MIHLYIIKMRTVEIIKYILFTYFTYFPYLLYNHSSNIGNLSIAGVGLGLIYCQQMFWIANFISFTGLYFYNMNLYYASILSFIICGYLYIVSLFKTIYLSKMFIV